MPSYLKAKSGFCGISVVAPVSTNTILVAKICENMVFQQAKPAYKHQTWQTRAGERLIPYLFSPLNQYQCNYRLRLKNQTFLMATSIYVMEKR